MAFADVGVAVHRATNELPTTRLRIIELSIITLTRINNLRCITLKRAA
jgi:hypothetical protein